VTGEDETESSSCSIEGSGMSHEASSMCSYSLEEGVAGAEDDGKGGGETVR